MLSPLRGAPDPNTQSSKSQFHSQEGSLETHNLSAGFLLLTLFTHQQFYKLWDLADWWGQMLKERTHSWLDRKKWGWNWGKEPRKRIWTNYQFPPNRKQGTPVLQEIHKPQTQKQKNQPTKQAVPTTSASAVIPLKDWMNFVLTNSMQWVNG